MNKISIVWVAIFLFFSPFIHGLTNDEQWVADKFVTHLPEDYFYESKEFVKTCLTQKKLILTGRPQEIPVNIWTLKAFYKNLGDLTFLTELRIMNHDLSTVPSEITKLKNLKKLYLLNNKLTAIPARILALFKLQVLSITNNYLYKIPDNIGVLKKLKFLDLSGNLIEKIPASITALTKLETLILSRNFIRKVSKHIGELSTLRLLVLSTNKIHLVPMGIQHLEKLEMLYLDRNPLVTTCNSINWGIEELEWFFRDRFYLKPTASLEDMREMLGFQPDIVMRKSH